MAAKTISMSILKQIIRLRQSGTALQRISKVVGVSRNTVKKYLNLISVKGYDYGDLLVRDDHELEQLLHQPDLANQDRYQALEVLLPHIDKELKRVGVTRLIMWSEYRAQHPDGYSYGHFCHHLNQWQQRSDATMHFEHQPAEKVFIDLAGKKLCWVDRHTGQVHEVEVYLAILAHSQLTFVRAIASQKKEDFIAATEQALHYFGGVPQVLIPDNLKSAVQKASKYEAEVNSDFADFANHYQTTVMPTRSYKPRDKALVEGAVKIAYSRIYAPLRDRVFFSLEELNDAISELLEQHNNQTFQNKDHSRRQLFEATEKHLLTPLTNERYELKKFKFIKVMKNCHINLSEDKHYYSVPYRYIGKKVKLIYSASKVNIFHGGQQIATYKRNQKQFAYTTTKEHLPSAHQFVSDWNPGKFLSWAAGIDSVVEEYIKIILESKSFPEQAYRSCVGILSQEKKVGRQRLIDAIQRATNYGVYNYRVIDRILKGGFDRITDEQPQQQIPFHDNIRGVENYQ